MAVFTLAFEVTDASSVQRRGTGWATKAEAVNFVGLGT